MLLPLSVNARPRRRFIHHLIQYVERDHLPRQAQDEGSHKGSFGHVRTGCGGLRSGRQRRAGSQLDGHSRPRPPQVYLLLILPLLAPVTTPMVVKHAPISDLLFLMLTPRDIQFVCVHMCVFCAVCVCVVFCVPGDRRFGGLANRPRDPKYADCMYLRLNPPMPRSVKMDTCDPGTTVCHNRSEPLKIWRLDCRP